MRLVRTAKGGTGFAPRAANGAPFGAQDPQSKEKKMQFEVFKVVGDVGPDV